MAVSVYLAIGVTPRAIHLNYDSIEAAVQMEQAWNALRKARQFTSASGRGGAGDEARDAPGGLGHPLREGAQVRAWQHHRARRGRAGQGDSRLLWQRDRPGTGAEARSFTVDHVHDVRRMHELLGGIVTVNQVGMFKLAEERQQLPEERFSSRASCSFWPRSCSRFFSATAWPASPGPAPQGHGRGSARRPRRRLAPEGFPDADNA